MNFWKGKKALFIGDSMTARGEYPQTVAQILGIQPFLHCKDGAHIVAMVDGELGLNTDYEAFDNPETLLRPLCAQDVRNMDLIILFGGYNNLLYGGYGGRSCDIGIPGDCYQPDGTGQDTVAGVMQYAIERIYDELQKAGNSGCRLLIVTVDCTGRNQWIDADGTQEFPAGSGKSYEKIANIQKAVADWNALPCCDLFHHSGINRHTWHIFSASQDSSDPYYSPFLLDENGAIIDSTRIRYQKGTAYYQHRNGKVTAEIYTQEVPYPYNADQIHKSDLGYRRIGEVVAGAIIHAYGN